QAENTITCQVGNGQSNRMRMRSGTVSHRILESTVAIVEQHADAVVEEIRHHDVVQADIPQVAGVYRKGRGTGVVGSGTFESAVGVAEQQADAVRDLVCRSHANRSIRSKSSNRQGSRERAHSVFSSIQETETGERTFFECFHVERSAREPALAGVAG